ncbi:MAG: hypothetical protein AAF399_22620 [Bacteroidota bacterium]
MKYAIILLSLLTVWGGSAWAQEGEKDGQIGPYRVAFMTRALGLDSEEAKQFWPVYEAFKKEQNALNKEKKALEHSMRQEMLKGDENKIETMADEFVEISRRQFEVQETYHAKFKEILPIRKVVLLYKAEQDFNRRLLEELRKRRQERRGNK